MYLTWFSNSLSRMFVNKVLRKIFGPKEDEVTGDREFW